MLDPTDTKTQNNRRSYGSKCFVFGPYRARGPAAIVNDRPILSSERMLHKDYNCKCSVEKILVVGLKGLGAKTN
jgi:hypothetical protein